MLEKNIRLEVTQEHIDKGVCENGDECAVALAFIDYFKDKSISYIEVEDYNIGLRFGDGKVIHSYRPTESQKQEYYNFIEDFDNDKTNVEPTEFNFVLTKD